MTSDLWDRKWSVFERRVRFFRYVPFVEFVLLAGSMATGRVHSGSDFDVILGTKEKRVWTAWLISLFVFHIFGWRARPGRDKKNKINISHVVSPNGYVLTPPYDEYWRNLYTRLIPVAGDKTKISAFFHANDWVGQRNKYDGDGVKLYSLNSFIKTVFEFFFGGHLGDWLESFYIKMYSGRVGDPKKLGYKPRLVYNADRLEMYRDTKRIEEKLRKGEI